MFIGNWDVMSEPITDYDLIHYSTFQTLAILRGIFESLPQVILQGYILIVQHQETSIVVVLSFLGSVVSLAWVMSGYLSKIDQSECALIYLFIY